MCKDYLGVVIPEDLEPVKEVPINATCLRCGHGLPWKVVPGNRMLEREAREQGKGLWGKGT